ncbi:MAG: MBOAT family O-acyltransferase [Kofleriaceae bacterium]
MLFSSPQYPLFLAAVFALYGLARTGRWPASVARVALMVLVGDLVWVLLTHDVGTLWDPIGGTAWALVTDTAAPAPWRYPLGLTVLGGALYLGLHLAGRHAPPPPALVSGAIRGATAKVVRRKKKADRKGRARQVSRRSSPRAVGDRAAEAWVSGATAHVLAAGLLALGAAVLACWATDTLDALTAAVASVGHLVYLTGLGFAVGAAQTERGRHLGRLLILGLVSAVFYHAWAAGQTGAYQYLLALIAATIVLDYYLARAIEATDHPAGRLALLVVSLVSNLGILAVFKYADFFRLDVLGTGGAPWHLLLPAGISFHTFQSLSYTVDVYRREIRATRSVIELATFVLFFPQLVAGPIVRATELLPQLRDLPLFDRDRAADGLARIVIGLAKKVALADFLGAALADRVFADPTLYSSAEVAAGVVAYAFQIYLDFSAYSDIAIGSAQVLGFTLPENFRTPYRSPSLQDFWRRWHITLSSWLRDYLYIPLGGNRGSELTTYRNLLVTMVLGGLWHGARWTFIAWGLLHGGGLAATRIFQRARSPRRAMAAAVGIAGLGLTLELAGAAPSASWAHLAFTWTWLVPVWAAITAALADLPAPVLLSTPRPRLATVLQAATVVVASAALVALSQGRPRLALAAIVGAAIVAWSADVAAVGPGLRGAARWLGWAAARAVATALVFAYVCLAWIFFRSATFDGALGVLRRLGAGEYDTPNLVPLVILALGTAALAHLVAPRTGQALRSRFVEAHPLTQGALLAVAALILRELAHPTIVPFIYFQF